MQFGRERPHPDVRPGVARTSTIVVIVFGVLMLALTITALVAALLG